MHTYHAYQLARVELDHLVIHRLFAQIARWLNRRWSMA